jgi:hypothetical protein
MLARDLVMHVRFVLIAAATLVSGQALAAGPAKPAPKIQPQPEHVSPQVVLASGLDVHTTPPVDPQAAATPKRRVARVTTCRCGDDAPQPDDQQ